MASLLFAAAAVTLSAPTLSQGLSIDDYPQWAMVSGSSAATLVRVAISPSGQVTECVSLQRFGDKALAQEACKLLKRRRLTPATLRSGEKVHAFFDSFVLFVMPETEQGDQMARLKPAPDLVVTVASLPKDLDVDIGVLIAVDATGKVIDCGAANEIDSKALVAAACSQRNLFPATKRLDQSGLAVPYVTRWQVQFTTNATVKS